MYKGYFYNIIFLAFENLIKCENKYQVDIENLSRFRKEIVRIIEENFDSLTEYRFDIVKDNLKKFIEENQEMTPDEENHLIDLFIDKNKDKFKRVGNTIYLDENIPFEDIAEARYISQKLSIRDTLIVIYQTASSIAAHKALGTTSIINDLKKMINVEKCVEETYLCPMKDTRSITNIGNMFVRGMFVIIASKSYPTISEYYNNLQEFMKLDNCEGKIGEHLLCDKTKTDDLYLGNPYIDDELSNIFQTAIFGNTSAHYNSLMNYFDEVWDYVYKDDMEDEFDANEDLEDYLPELDEEDYRTVQDEYDPEKIDLYFYLNYILRLNGLSNSCSDDKNNTTHRLLYALNHYDSNLNDINHFKSKYKELDEELSYCDRDDYKDYYIMSMLFLKDILNGNIDQYSLKKVIFISCYYDITLDFRIRKVLEGSINSNNSRNKIIYDSILNHNYDLILTIFDKDNKKIKE